MRIIKLKILTDYCAKRKDSKLTKQADAWIQEVKVAKWQTSQNLLAHYPKASIIGKKNVVFNLLGNNYRLWIKINYPAKTIIIKKVGTHAEYDRWDIKKGKG